VDIFDEPGANILAKALNYIKNNPPAVTTNYTFVLNGDCSMDGVDYYPNITTPNAVITLLGKDSPRTISLSGTGSLFYISAGELILDNNVTLKGLTTNNSALVYVGGASASLTMKAGAKISGNSSTGYGGGVFVRYGSFTMSGGEISDNSTTGYGGGVAVVNNSTFTMKAGAKISGNSSAINGGGVAVVAAVNANASFIMSGGEISGNSGNLGGGVFVIIGSFSMEGGEISGNSASIGGGVCVYPNSGVSGSFSKTGNSVIYGDNDGTPFPDNGSVTDNTAKNGNTNGHAVHYQDGSNRYYRDDILGSGDNISTETVPDFGTDYGWTKK
jgi:hypothetical protein